MIFSADPDPIWVLFWGCHHEGNKWYYILSSWYLVSLGTWLKNSFCVATFGYP